MAPENERLGLSLETNSNPDNVCGNQLKKCIKNKKEL